MPVTLPSTPHLAPPALVWHVTIRPAHGRRCATPFGVDIVGITELVALVGAIVGGLAARQRKREAERLNEQLRKINLQLRQQARAGTMYAPGLSYAPQVSSLSVKPGSGGNGTDPGAAAGGGGHTDAAANGSAVATTGATATLTKPPATEEAVSSAPAQALSTVDEEMTQEQQSCRETMREGKRLLRNGQGTPSAASASSSGNGAARGHRVLPSSAV